MASTDTYTVHTVFTEIGGSYEMAVYCTRDAAVYAYDRRVAGAEIVCDHCDEVVLGDDAFQPFTSETDECSSGYVACLPCYIQGVVNSGEPMIISGQEFVESTGRHAAA